MSTPLNLYLVARPDQPGWDEYDSFVVAAATAEEAANTQPSTMTMCWPVNISTLTVTLIGVAAEGVKPGVILGSFNAG